MACPGGDAHVISRDRFVGDGIPAGTRCDCGELMTVKDLQIKDLEGDDPDDLVRLIPAP